MGRTNIIHTLTATCLYRVGINATWHRLLVAALFELWRNIFYILQNMLVNK